MCDFQNWSYPFSVKNDQPQRENGPILKRKIRGVQQIAQGFTCEQQCLQWKRKFGNHFAFMKVPATFIRILMGSLFVRLAFAKWIQALFTLSIRYVLLCMRAYFLTLTRPSHRCCGPRQSYFAESTLRPLFAFNELLKRVISFLCNKNLEHCDISDVMYVCTYWTLYNPAVIENESSIYFFRIFLILVHKP